MSEPGGHSGLTVGSARGGRRVPAEPLLAEIVRELGEADLPELVAPPPVGSQTSALARLSHSHHALARALAEGRSAVEAGLIAGYSVSRVSILQRDPAFAELLAHYGAQRELQHIDVLERLRILGLNSVEELQARLEENPNAFSPRELMELTELALIKGRQAPGSRQGAGAGATGTGAAPVNVQVTFVAASHGPMIEGEAREAIER